MSDIKVEKMDAEKLAELGVEGWPVWTKEVSRFDWHYDSVEKCYILEGQVSVETENGTVEFGKGDFVTFPEGLSCTWDVKEPIRKHYTFE